MLFKTAITYAVALVAALPMVAAEYQWDDLRQVYNIGEVPTQNRKSHRVAKWMGRCGGNDIKVGGYGCGQFGVNGTLGHGIYKCVEDPKKYEGAWLQYQEVCLWQDFGAGNGGDCTRNQRRKGKKFFPLLDGKKVVCITTDELSL
jgi:hypothetical protein